MKEMRRSSVTSPLCFGGAGRGRCRREREKEQLIHCISHTVGIMCVAGGKKQP